MTAPYPGLRPYDENERDNFFGREADSKILIDQILANRLTLLFAATGVGKSSLLKASVIPRLKEPLGENLDVVFFNDWVAPPLPNLKQTILRTLHEQGDLEQDVVEPEVLDASLGKFLEFCCLFTSQPFLIVLDQFEEFFRYRGNYPKEHSQTLIEQLTDVILNKDIPVAVVLSMREDYALELNDFKPKLPMILFENYYRLEKLTREAAMDAIKIPAQRVGFKYEEELFELLLKDLLSHDFDRSTGGLVVNTTETVEPSYLQIVCSQLWERNKDSSDKILHLEIYKASGYAKGLVGSYLDVIIEKFPPNQKPLVLNVFDYLVVMGMKQPYTSKVLSRMVGFDESLLTSVLELLQKNRIVRTQNKDGTIWYEIYHDMFSAAIEAWKDRNNSKIDYKNLLDALNKFDLRQKNIVSVIFGLIVERRGNVVNFGSSELHDVFESKRFSALEINKVLGELVSSGLIFEVKHKNESLYFINNEVMRDHIRLWNKEWMQVNVYRKRVISLSAVFSLGLIFVVSYDAWLNFTGVHLRMSLSSPYSMVELWQGKQGSMDFFGQQRFISQADQQVKDREPDKRLFEWSVNEVGQLNAELVGTLPLKERVAGFSRDGQYDRALNIAKISISSTDTSQSRGVIANLANVHVVKVSELLWDKMSDGLPESLRQAINLGFSPDNFVSWLNDETTIVARLNSKNAQQSIMLVRTLSQLGSFKALPALLVQLKDDDATVRSSVAQALGQLGSIDALPALLAQLKDGDATVRSSVAQALGQLGSVSALPSLLVQLKDDDANVRSSVVQALGQLGSEEALPALVVQLKDDNLVVRSIVAHTLGGLGSVDALPALLAQLKDDDSNVRSSVVQALGGLGSVDALSALLAQLKDDDSDVRSNAGQALGQLGSIEVLSALVTQLKNDDANMRSNVAWVLGRLGSVEVLPALLAQLKDDDSNVRSSVVQALGGLGSVDALPALLAQLKDDDSNVRVNVGQALGELGSVDALPALLAQLKDDDVNVRSSVAAALGQLGSEEALPALLAQLKYDDVNMRSSVAAALGQLGSEEALPALLAQLKDDDVNVRSSVAAALGQLGSEEALPALLAQLKDDDVNVRSSVAAALGQLGSEEALPALSNLFGQEKQSEIVKATAALGLLKLGDKQGYNYLLGNIGNLAYRETYTDPVTREENIVTPQSTILTGVGGGQTALENSCWSSSTPNAR